MALSGIFLTQDSNISNRGGAKAQPAQRGEPAKARQRRGREEITRTSCRSPTSPQSPQRTPQSGVHRRLSGGPSPSSTSSVAGSRRGSLQHPIGSPSIKSRTLLGAGESSPGEVQFQTAFDFSPAALRAAGLCSASNPCDERNKLEDEAKAQAQKTMQAVDSALRAVQAISEAGEGRSLRKRGHRSPLMSPTSPDSDVGSLASVASFASAASTASTSSTAASHASIDSMASTASTRSCSKDSGTARRRATSLQDARMSHKEKVKAQERSVRFNRGVLEKLDEIRSIPTLCN